MYRHVIEERTAQLQQCMYQYSRAIYRSVKDMIDPYADRETQLESRRGVLIACEQTMERLASDPLYFAKPDRALFQDIRRFFPITAQAQVAWAVQEGVKAAVLGGGAARRRRRLWPPSTGFHRCDPQLHGCSVRRGLSHDTDKLIRQLSLVAFLMAERRAITARDVKSNVEGYSEMSDEA